MASYPIHGRVTFIHPGKHGDKDIRVEIGGIAPTHAETLAMLYGKFWAEDRYDKPWQKGRAWLKELIDEIHAAKSWDEVKHVLERCDASIVRTPT